MRAVSGWLMTLHGMFKINELGLGNFEKYMLQPAGLPLTGVLSWLVPSTELVFGAMLIVGLLTRVAAAFLCLEMLGTGFIIKIHFHLGILGPKGSGGAEVDFLMLAGLLIPLMLGPGAWSIDALLRLDRPWTRVPRATQEAVHA
ncbi:DoxX family protein [Streptomyces sp. CA-142005]|uniref:DoxX family protein n=1 Tax=Streptomyces sp. CA-142005 TaxID=3240052 RepID=UPI003D927236